MAQKDKSKQYSKYFSITFVSLIILFILIPAEFGSSNGTHTGVVTSVEYNSNIIWGATLVYFKTVRESSQEDKYCVNSEKVKNKLIEAAKNKEEVTIYYKNDFLMWKWQCNGAQTIIYRVEGAGFDVSESSLD